MVLSIWSWSLLQFTVLLTPSKNPPKRTENPTKLQRAKEICCSIDVWEVLFNIILQDAPFFVFRLLLITYYKLISYMNIFFTCKNTLVITLQFYRLMVVQLEKREALAKEAKMLERKKVQQPPPASTKRTTRRRQDPLERAAPAPTRRRQRSSSGSERRSSKRDRRGQPHAELMMTGKRSTRERTTQLTSARTVSTETSCQSRCRCSSNRLQVVLERTRKFRTPNNPNFGNPNSELSEP